MPAKTRTQDKCTLYSVVGSLGVHLLFFMGAGSFLLSINKDLTPPKTYKLEFVKRKTPVKKVEMRKEIVRKEIKVASLQPKVIPVAQPRTVVRQTRQLRPVVLAPKSAPKPIQKQSTPVRQSAIMHSSRPTISRRASVPRSFASTSNTTSAKGSTRVAMIQGTSHFTPRNLPKQVARASVSTPASSGTSGRVAPIQTGVKLASFSLPTPRGVPNIVDRGALKGYIGRIKRRIEGAKQYPESSRKAGREGRLKVQFTLFKNGEVGNIKLITKTPYPNLNREAMAAVKRAAPFSGFPDSMMEQSLQIILPFRFELN